MKAWWLALSCAACSPPPAPPGATVTVDFVGDVLLDSAAGQTIRSGGDPFAASAEILSQADLVVANLECPVATGGAKVEKMYTFRADPLVLPVLSRHVHAVSLANNHSGDYGRGALSETMSHLRASRLPFFGAGRDLASAHAPLILQRNGLRIALLGYDEFHPRWFEARQDAPGVAWSEDEQAALDIARARAHADVVIPFLHWGWENTPRPSERQRQLAHLLIDAGADAVVGAHPHVTQGAEQYRGKPIVYSLGNFVFDLLDEPANARGWILRLSLDQHGVARFDTIAVDIDAQGSPRPQLGERTPCGSRNAPLQVACRP